MSAIAAAAALAAAVLVLTIPPRPSPIHTRVAVHLDPLPASTQRRRPSPAWARAAIVGGISGIVLPIAWGAGMVIAAPPLGALAGAWLASAHHRTHRARISARQTAEVPTVADALAIHILAGDPITEAAARVSALTQGAVAEDLAHALADADGFAAALTRIAAGSPSHHAARLYRHLARAHRTGGGLADSLTSLAADVRAAMSRDLAAEGGRRALAAYGPILGLMVPTTLLFLMYPTVVALTSLSGS